MHLQLHPAPPVSPHVHAQFPSLPPPSPIHTYNKPPLSPHSGTSFLLPWRLPGWRPPAPSPPLECAERGQALLSATLHSQLPDIITISTGSLVEAWLAREILTALSAISNSVCRKISSWLGEGNSEIFEKKRSGCRSRISQ